MALPNQRWRACYDQPDLQSSWSLAALSTYRDINKMLQSLFFIGLLSFQTLLMVAALANGHLGGLGMLIFIVPTVYGINQHFVEQEQIRKRQEEARLKADEQARQERARKEWEQTPAGRAHLDQQARLEEERRQREAEDAERRRGAGNYRNRQRAPSGAASTSRKPSSK
jgi:hypothetical protein